MSNLDEIFADVTKEGENPFDALETETPSESQTENEPKVEEPVVGDLNTPSVDDVPFHKHPRWQQMQEKASKVDTLETELAELRESVNQRHEEPGDSDVPDWFQRLYGNDPVAFKAYSEEQVRLKEQVKQELVQEQEAVRQQALAEEQASWDYINDSYDRLESEGKKFNRNELAKVMLDFAPTNSDGNLDFDKGYQLLEALKPTAETSARSTARKQLAATATATTTGEPPKKDYVTSNELRNRSWASL